MSASLTYPDAFKLPEKKFEPHYREMQSSIQKCLSSVQDQFKNAEKDLARMQRSFQEIQEKQSRE